jgi:phosphate transport system substrate-binding protein
MRKLMGLAIVLVIPMLMLAGCSKPGDAAKSGEVSTSVTVKGSDTMVNLSTAWAEAFMKANPGKQVIVAGGGSGIGISSLINGTTDLANASRPMKDEEKAKLPGYKEYRVAMDCITIVVNPKNPVNKLTMDQLAKIFTGEVKSWKDFGGPDKPINILSRESSSGTYAFFQEHVLKKKDYSKDAKLLTATNPIIEEVSTNDFAIGYVGLGYAVKAGSKVKIVSVKKDDKSAAVMPSEATVYDGSYPIARALYIYAAKEPTGIAKDFIDFCLSPEGQKIAQAQDEIPVK